MQQVLDIIRVILEILAVLFLPTIAWLLKTANAHSKQILVLEEKVNAEIARRLSEMERKIDSFDNKIEQKIDRLDNNLNSKVEIMTAIVSNFVHNARKEDREEN